MWKYIKNFEGLYSIDEYGNVYNHRYKIIMKPYFVKGYKCVDLSKNGTKYKFTVHRLVALTFLENPNNYPVVMHLDNNKLNTHYTNLKWGTYSENNAQAIRDKLNVVPRPDNRDFFDICSPTGERLKICYGVDDVIKETQYQYSKHGMYSMIFRKDALKCGPYQGCTVQRSTAPQLIIFD